MITGEQLFSVECTPDIMAIFHLTAESTDIPVDNAMPEEQPVLEVSPTVDSSETSCKQSKFHWSKNATLALIAQYQAHYANFSSTTGKKDTVWATITRKMKDNGHVVSVMQCKDKFKYLKQGYMKKADNMKRDKNSGSEVFHFEYFMQMDEIFGKKPNVDPIYVASSSRANSK